MKLTIKREGFKDEVNMQIDDKKIVFTDAFSFHRFINILEQLKNINQAFEFKSEISAVNKGEIK